MLILKNAIKIIFLLSLSMVLLACNQKSTTDNKNKSAVNNPTIKVGTIAGPETQLMEVAQKVAAKKQLHIEIISFTDYTMPNEALAEGSIDANMFQHGPYLKEASKVKGYTFVSAAKTFIYPMGVYSKKIDNLEKLKEGAVIAIPNDPSNEARALLLLQKAGLIQLKPDANIHATLTDIINNPKQLKFKELDAAQLPRILPDVDAAAINTNYAIVANLFPSKDALITEDANSPYANLLVVRKEDKNNPNIKKLVKALHSDEVVQEANILFKGQAIQAWKKKKEEGTPPSDSSSPSESK